MVSWANSKAKIRKFILQYAPGKNAKSKVGKAVVGQVNKVGFYRATTPKASRAVQDRAIIIEVQRRVLSRLGVSRKVANEVTWLQRINVASRFGSARDVCTVNAGKVFLEFLKKNRAEAVEQLMKGQSGREMELETRKLVNRCIIGFEEAIEKQSHMYRDKQRTSNTNNSILQDELANDQEIAESYERLLLKKYESGSPVIIAPKAAFMIINMLSEQKIRTALGDKFKQFEDEVATAYKRISEPSQN
jgi:hypothetical protein